MEKEKRLLVIILAFLLFRLWVIVPYIASMETLQDEYTTLRRSVDKAQALLDDSGNRGKYLQELEAAEKENTQFLIAVDLESKEALSIMQKNLQTFMEEKGFEVVSTTWGEPYQADGTDYIRLSLSFVASTDPNGLHLFLEWIGKRKPLLLFDGLTIRLQRKELKITGQVIGFVRQAG